MFKIKKQLSRLYISSALGNLSLTGAWVALLAARGFSLVEIGIAETVFHITSLVFEIPSGVFADVFGRKKMLVVSAVMRMVGNFIMIFSNNLFTVCLSIIFWALSYNFTSGSGDALAYDSLKLSKQESKFEKFESNQLSILSLCGGVSTLCVGIALAVGHKIAYGVDIVIGVIQIFVLASLEEISFKIPQNNTIIGKLTDCFKESFAFIKEVRKVMGLMLCNSFVGAVATLLLFFLQAKLPEKGVPEKYLGLLLMFTELGGVVGSRLILKFPKLSYKQVLFVTVSLVIAGFIAEHSPLYLIMALGGFIAALGDDALQVRTNAILQNMFPSEQRTTLTSVESFSFSVIMIALSPLAGFVFTYW